MGKTKVGKGMKLEIVVDRSGLPLGLEVAAADVSENELLMSALEDVPVEVPPGTPVVADKGHDSDPLRDELEAANYIPVIPHRKNRVKPSRNDGRRLRRYRHRWLVERTNAWLHCYRGLAVRWSYFTIMSSSLPEFHTPGVTAVLKQSLASWTQWVHLRSDGRATPKWQPVSPKGFAMIFMSGSCTSRSEP